MSNLNYYGTGSAQHLLQVIYAKILAKSLAEYPKVKMDLKKGRLYTEASWRRKSNTI